MVIVTGSSSAMAKYYEFQKYPQEKIDGIMLCGVFCPNCLDGDANKMSDETKNKFIKKLKIAMEANNKLYNMFPEG